MSALSNHQCLKDFYFKTEAVDLLRKEWDEKASHREKSKGVTSYLRSVQLSAHYPQNAGDIITNRYLECSYLSSMRYYGHLLNPRSDMPRSRAQVYSKILEEHGSPLDRCIGFIDYKKIPICCPGRPTCLEQSLYSGRRRVHHLTYETSHTPGGLIFTLYRPVEGRCCKSWSPSLTSKWDGEYIEGISFHRWEVKVIIRWYGDSAYLLRPGMVWSLIREFTSTGKLEFNSVMSSIPLLVEQKYCGDLKDHWKSQDYHRNLKVRQSSIDLLYKASKSMLNFYTCIYWSGKTIQRFGLA